MEPSSRLDLDRQHRRTIGARDRSSATDRLSTVCSWASSGNVDRITTTAD
ncbi:MAG: hypothetical protein LH613_05690 [Chamaesiphon sp.]|nr:hypothetical protein [Chamaesiphon sp.]